MVDHALFRHFVPMHILPPQERAELARHTQLSRFEPGQSPFRRGISSSAAIYLVSGEVALEDAHGSRTIAAGTEAARHALSNADQFTATARCTQPSSLLMVDRAKLDFVMTWAQSGTIEVEEIGHGDSQDWMGMMLQCPAMQLIPAANIARVLSRVEPVEARAGTIIIQQGAPGDSYYVLTDGLCSVWRRDNGDAQSQRIGAVTAGHGFGEEALLSGDPRNASVRAEQDCRLVRLDAADFSALLQAPVLQKADLANPPARALIVDVRLPEEFAHGHLPGAVNLPLRAVRERARELDRTRALVVYCDGGRRSAAATFLLCERGFDASWVAGGVSAESMVR